MAKPTVSVYVPLDEREKFLNEKDKLVKRLNDLTHVIGEWSVSRLLRAAVGGELVELEDGVYIQFKVANKAQ